MPSRKRKRQNTNTKSKSAARTRVKKAARSKRVGKAKTKKRPSKKVVNKNRAAKTPKSRKQRRSVSTAREITQEVRGKGLRPSGTASGRPLEDFEGLSRAPEADSESVAELVEEGNIFEAGAVAGVEQADNADEREVHAHEVPEDDVPDEYLDKE